MNEETKREKTGLDLVNEIRANPDAAPEHIKEMARQFERNNSITSAPNVDVRIARSSDRLTAIMSALAVLLEGQQELLEIAGFEKVDLNMRLKSAQQALYEQIGND